MASRGMELGGDLDNLASASKDEFEAALKKFCATKNVRPDTAIRWAMQRALNDEHRNFIKSKFDEYYNSAAGLL